MPGGRGEQDLVQVARVAKQGPAPVALRGNHNEQHQDPMLAVPVAPKGGQGKQGLVPVVLAQQGSRKKHVLLITTHCQSRLRVCNAIIPWALMFAMLRDPGRCKGVEPNAMRIKGCRSFASKARQALNQKQNVEQYWLRLRCTVNLGVDFVHNSLCSGNIKKTIAHFNGTDLFFCLPLSALKAHIFLL